MICEQWPSTWTVCCFLKLVKLPGLAPLWLWRHQNLTCATSEDPAEALGRWIIIVISTFCFYRLNPKSTQL